jgi:Holliday junction resolvase-like predicted endonuclease
MTADSIFELRKNKQTVEAYEAARQLYATDKSPAAVRAMFWTAVDMVRYDIEEERLEDASKIMKALERLLPNVPDKEGWAKESFERCQQKLETAEDKVTRRNNAEHNQMGAWGEAVAVEYLREKGYVIIDRDWHSGHRDIDIIALHDEMVVFVEVKTRRDTIFHTPEEAVDYRKMNNLRRAINHYVKYRKIDNPIRFDIITVVGSLGCPHPIINHIEDVNMM